MMSPVLALLFANGCLVVAGARITAGDLKSMVSEFAHINDDVEFGYSPAPGTTRWIRPAELATFAFRHEIASVHTAELCVTRQGQFLTPESAESAIRRSLQQSALGDAIHIELIDYVRLPLPRGEVVFSPDDLHASNQGVFLWRGRVEYDRHRNVPVWVKARIVIDRPAIHSLREIAKGQILTDADVETRVIGISLDQALRAKELSAAAGMEALCDIPAGQRITPDQLARPLAIHKGDSISAISESRGVRLTIDALALRQGRIGDVIPIASRSNKRTLRAAITAPGQVRIVQERNENEQDRGARNAAGVHSAGGKGQGAEADAAR